MHPKITAVLAGGALLALAGCAAPAATRPGSNLNSSITSANASIRASRSAQARADNPDPSGTYTGSCDYTLGDSPATGTAIATGEVDVVNTGNIGTVVSVSITWPQEGFAPLAMHSTVKVPAGTTKPVSFHRPLSSEQVDNLQGWQLGHGAADGCTYNATITTTYGVTS